MAYYLCPDGCLKCPESSTDSAPNVAAEDSRLESPIWGGETLAWIMQPSSPIAFLSAILPFRDLASAALAFPFLPLPSSSGLAARLYHIGQLDGQDRLFHTNGDFYLKNIPFPPFSFVVLLTIPLPLAPNGTEYTDSLADMLCFDYMNFSKFLMFILTRPHLAIT